MPGVGANRRFAAWVNESRAVALCHVLESARYRAKASTEARAVGRLLTVGSSPTGWPPDRRFAAVAAGCNGQHRRSVELRPCHGVRLI
jgi:hypothetical protein